MLEISEVRIPRAKYLFRYVPAVVAGETGGTRQYEVGLETGFGILPHAYVHVRHHVVMM